MACRSVLTKSLTRHAVLQTDCEQAFLSTCSTRIQSLFAYDVYLGTICSEIRVAIDLAAPDHLPTTPNHIPLATLKQGSYLPNVFDWSLQETDFACAGSWGY